MPKVTLKTPIMRGETEIKDVDIREPKAGDLRGIKMMHLLELDASQFIELLPRISTPVLSKADIMQLDALTLTQFMQVTLEEMMGK